MSVNRGQGVACGEKSLFRPKLRTRPPPFDADDTYVSASPEFTGARWDVVPGKTANGQSPVLLVR